MDRGLTNIFLRGRWLFWFPGTTLIVLGGSVGGRLLVGPLPVGRIQLDTNALLLCALMILVGSQLCFSGAITQAYAVREGLGPPTSRFTNLSRVFTLEIGIAAGLILFGVGAGLLVRAFLVWRSASFGALSYSSSLRLVVPSVTCITLGVQTFFSSFLLSVLSLPKIS